LPKAARGACLVEHRSTHPVEDVHLTGEPIGEAKAENAVADPGGLSYVWRQADHRSGAIG
jgi:hypothetical protein